MLQILHLVLPLLTSDILDLGLMQASAGHPYRWMTSDCDPGRLDLPSPCSPWAATAAASNLPTADLLIPRVPVEKKSSPYPSARGSKLSHPLTLTPPIT